MFHFNRVLFFFLILPFLGLNAQEIDAQRMDGSKNFEALSIEKQQRLLLSLRQNSGPYGHNLIAYYLPKKSPHLAWADADFLTLLYTMSAHNSESNCYWTSMLARGVVQMPERFMDLPEYEQLLSRHFQKIEGRDHYLPGDILRLKRVRGNMDTHSVIYLGPLKDHPYNILVLTKNGPKDGPYLIMDLSDLTTKIYPSSVIFAAYRIRN